MKILMILLTLLTCAANATIMPDQKAAFEEKMKARFGKLTPKQQQTLNEQMREAKELASQKNLVQKTSLLDNLWAPVTCIGISYDVMIVGVSLYQCASVLGDVFMIDTFGVRPGLGGSVDILVGISMGRPEAGTYPLAFTAGLHYKLGGTVLVAGPLVLLGGGAGMNAFVLGGVPSDSLTGGQLKITPGFMP